MNIIAYDCIPFLLASSFIHGGHGERSLNRHHFPSSVMPKTWWKAGCCLGIVTFNMDHFAVPLPL